MLGTAPERVMTQLKKPDSESKREPEPAVEHSHDEHGRLTAAGRKWQEENAEAIKGWNEWVEKNGLPLRRYRSF